MSTNAESGLRSQRIDFARESSFGSALSDPDFLKYSDTVTNVSATPEAMLEERRGLGNADPTDFQRGPESHEVTVGYDLIKWFTDGSGNANDAAYDGMARTADNRLPNSHALVVREDKGALASGNTVSGNTSYSSRIYVVCNGGLISEATITGDPSDSQPVSVEVTYTFQKLRTYQIDQPDSSTYLTLNSTDSNDTGLTVTIEDEGGNTTEDVSLDGSDATTVVSTTNQFGDVDAIHVTGDNAGDIEVAINDGSDTSPTKGDKIAVIAGETTYGGVESDDGVPALGNGSRESVGSLGDPETFIGDRILRSSNPFPHEINSATLTVSNNLETTEVSDGYGMSIHPGNRNLTMEATLFGENTTWDMVKRHLQNDAENVGWEMDGGTVQLDSAVLSEPGEIAKEEGQAVMTTDNTFTGSGLTFS